jgi:quercetin dioxygenase-like cupin family protein
MTSSARQISGALLLAIVAGSVAWARARAGTSHSVARQRARVVLSQALPKLDGEQLKATLVDVSYGPGESSPPHLHPCAVIGYVVEGALRTQINGEPEMIYRAGESFYEAPNGVHAISANAGTAEPAKFVAFFVCDRETPLSVDVPGSKVPGEK